MDYDVLILGGGIVGCTVAYELSKYNLNIALIEKASDIAEDISLINTSVVYDGSETTNKTISEYERKGCKLIEEACKKFNVPYKKVGALRVASDDYGVFKLKEMYSFAKERGIEKISLLSKEEVIELENNINIDVKQGLYSEDVAVVSPYELSISYAEVAADNGVNFRFEEEVVNIAKISKGFKVITNKNKFTCRVVINTTPFDINMGDNISEQNYNVKEEDVIKLGFPYEVIRDAYRIAIPDTKTASNLIIEHQDIFNDFEITKGKMDDVFLQVTGKKLGDNK